MASADVQRMPASRRLMVVVAILAAVLYWVPFAFVLGGLLTLCNWDAARRSRSADRGWYHAWCLGLGLTIAGLIWTVYLIPYVHAM